MPDEKQPAGASEITGGGFNAPQAGAKPPAYDAMLTLSQAAIKGALLNPAAEKPVENEEILERLKGPQGWKFVLDHYCDDIYAILRKMMYTVDDDDLGDMFLFVFQRLSMNDGRKLKQFRGAAKFKTWLTAAVRNLARDWVRMKKRKELPVGPMLERVDKDGNLSRFEPEDDAFAPEIAYEEQRMYAMLDSVQDELKAAIERLDDASKAVCKFWFYDRLSAGEIARLMGLESDRSVYQTTGKILKALSADLESKGYEARRMRDLLQRLDA